MNTNISLRELLFTVAGLVSGLAITYISWLMTENFRLTSENEAIKNSNAIIQGLQTSATMAKLKADEAQALVDVAKIKVQDLESTLKSIKAFANADKAMNELRTIASDEAKRKVEAYLKSTDPFKILAVITVKKWSYREFFNFPKCNLYKWYC